MKLVTIFVVAMCLVAVSSAVSLNADAPPDRQIAITVDDLPAGAANFMSATTILDLTSRLLAALQEQKVPAVGFVNEKKLYKWGEVDQRIKALEMWVDAGFELGNHTYSHASLNKVGLKAWEEEVIEGEPVIRMLLAEHKMQLRYFRHPYLDTGRDLETRRDAEAFLAARGYIVAPVTIDAWDWMFAFVYEDAKKKGDAALQDQVAKAYLSHTDAMFAYDEQLSRQVVGYEPKQILLLHANELEADHFRDLAELIRKRGYRFITLEDALTDPAYGLPDTYVGEEGATWLTHWAVSQGKPPHGEPVFPPAILQIAQALRQPQ
jgi:peptidoglycan-N-acetylglucosamine deacetylase